MTLSDFKTSGTGSYPGVEFLALTRLFWYFYPGRFEISRKSRRGRWRIWFGNKRRGFNDFTGTSQGGEEVGVVKFQGVEFGYIFLGKDVVQEFQYLRIIPQDGTLDCIGDVGDPMVNGWSRFGGNGGFRSGCVQCSGQVSNMIAISRRWANQTGLLKAWILHGAENGVGISSDCLLHGVCLVQVWRFLWIGNSGKSEQFSVTSESEEDKSVGIMASRCSWLSLKCKPQRSSKGPI